MRKSELFKLILVLLLGLSLTVFTIGCSDDDDDDDNGDGITAPNAPTNVQGIALSETEIQITWEDVENETGYRVEQKTDGEFVDVSGGLAENTTTYTDTDLNPNQEYTYRVAAYNTAGTNMSEEISVTTAIPEVQVITGNIVNDMTLTNDRDWLLRGTVFVEAPNTLEIQAGTTIYGENNTLGTLAIKQGAMIMAEGTADAPIVFTSDQPEGQRARGQWGGLIINGKAPINTGDYAWGEGNTGKYGGDVADDNSGILRYVRVEFAGIEFSPDNELNGIAFQGVGSATTAEYLQVHFNQDDGIEFFGGTANLKYALCTGIRDDNFDWTDGWRGKAQFLVAQQKGDDADQGIEADNNGENNELEPYSNPQIYNVTLIGDPSTDYGDESDTGILLREGTKGTLRNIIVMGFKNKAGLDIDDEVSHNWANSGDLSVQNCIFYENGPGNFSTDTDEYNDDGVDHFDEGAWAMTAGFNNYEATSSPITNPYDLMNPDFRSTGAATDGTVPVATPPADGFFEQVNFIGGVDPNNDWTQGWTTTAQN